MRVPIPNPRRGWRWVFGRRRVGDQYIEDGKVTHTVTMSDWGNWHPTLYQPYGKDYLICSGYTRRIRRKRSIDKQKP